MPSLITAIVEGIGTTLELLAVFIDVASIAGEDFLSACIGDPACYNTLLKMAAESETIKRRDYKLTMMYEEIMHKKVVAELKRRLKEIGARVKCSEEECWIEYEGEEIELYELEDESEDEFIY